MDYSGNLLSETWTTVGVTTEAEYFKLVDNASMYQEVSSLLFVLEPRDFKVKADFYFSTTPSIINAKIKLTLKYYDGNNDKFIIPLVPIGTAALGWYSREELCNVRTDSVLLSVEFEVLVADVANDFRIRSIELQRSITPLEMHEINPNPHQLPLAITVSQEGIKATKGEIIKFWLKDTGDAEFAGELKSATGTFLGSVVVGEDTTFDEGYDPSEAISQVEGWTYTGTTKIDGGQIYTGTILAATIKAGELIVGSNVGLGTAVDEDGVVSILEMHEINPNPHQLPLAITVSQEGIKATKGEIIKFWLKDTGDAEFAGELKSATGTFLGSVVVGEDTTFDEGYDPSEAISQVEGWTYTGTTKIDGGQIYTGTILAAAIKAGELIVGSNVGLGTAVDEDGVVSIIDGTITADYINALGVGALKIYKLGYPNNYMTIGGTYADLELYHNGYEIFAIENTPGSGAYLRAAGAPGNLATFLDTTGIYSAPHGTWDFQYCTVVNLGVTATFG